MSASNINSPMHYLFLNYKNARLSSFAPIDGHQCKIILLMNGNEDPLSVKLTEAAQKFDGEVQCIKVKDDAKKGFTLEFYAALYLGQQIEKDPQGIFYLISKDIGHDPLIEHLRGNNISIQRYNKMSDIPVLKSLVATQKNTNVSIDLKIKPNINSVNKKADDLTKYLLQLDCKPKKVSKLRNAIQALFGKQLTISEVVDLINEMIIRHLIIVCDGKVYYKFGVESTLQG